MKTVETFPHRVREIENLWIPMPDGARLAARVWLPEDAEAAPVPAILEYIPYRKRDFTRGRDEPMHHYFAGHGYAALRVDLRGSGDSDGVLTDEYTEQEIVDALAVIAWIARQRWCSGAVGMMGISWGGFNALQVAARRPPALGAIISLCAADDRYADDAHYMGGCLLNENLSWGSVLFHFNALPPDPTIVGEHWRELWRERLEHARLFPAHWLRHPHRDEYWRHGSVAEDYAAIACPVYAIGGWADAYSNAVPRLLAGLRVPRKGLIGPWSHMFPHDGAPGPTIGFLQEALRWWDHWLKKFDNGIMREPMLRAWMQEAVAPQPYYDERPGRWVAETQWPSARIEPRLYAMNPGKLEDQAGPSAPLHLQSPQSTGLAAGDWCGFGALGEAPNDQRGEDGRSLSFDSAPLAERVEILGAPVVELTLAVDQPTALIAVRLNDLAPDGASTRVSYGLLNLTHRDDHAVPAALAPGERYRVRVQLNDCAFAFPAGHAMRVAVSTSYWPIAWPAPTPVNLTLYAGECYLTLPVRPTRAADVELPAFKAPERAPAPDRTMLYPAKFRRTIERDLASNETVYTIFSDGGDYEGAAVARLHAIDLELGNTVLKRFRIGETDPLSARAENVQKTILRRGDWAVRIETRIELSSNANNFYVRAELTAFENDKRVFSKNFDETIKRILV